jgi:hypothetical protein
MGARRLKDQADVNFCDDIEQLRSFAGDLLGEKHSLIGNLEDQANATSAQKARREEAERLNADLLAACEAALPAIRASAVEARESLRLAEEGEFASNISAATMTELREFAKATADRVVTTEAVIAKARGA